MKKGRLEAFSDGVLAIIITIMVLEMKVPHGEELTDLKELAPVFLSYILSFVNVGLYWNNHHHLFQVVEHVNGKVLWANIHLLFWLSLLPFATGWMGENHFAKWPVILYGIVLFMAGAAYFFLVLALKPLHRHDSLLAQATTNNRKETYSVLIYIAGIGVAFADSKLALALYFIVATMWLIPDRRIEKKINHEESGLNEH